MLREHGEGRAPAGSAALRVENPGDGFDVPRVRQDAAAARRNRHAAVALRTLRPADRRRVLQRLGELDELARIAREPGTLAAASRGA